MTQHAQQRFTGRRLADLGVLVALAALVGWYFVDAYTASSAWLNLILVLPLTVAILSLCAVAFVRELRANPEVVDAAGNAQDTIDSTTPVSDVLPVMALFSGYVLSLNWLGFDVGTALFIAAFLFVYGERRWQWLIAYPVVFASVMSLFFGYMLPYPLPMLVFPA